MPENKLGYKLSMISENQSFLFFNAVLTKFVIMFGSALNCFQSEFTVKHMYILSSYLSKFTSNLRCCCVFDCLVQKDSVLYFKRKKLIVAVSCC